MRWVRVCCLLLLVGLLKSLPSESQEAAEQGVSGWDAYTANHKFVADLGIECSGLARVSWVTGQGFRGSSEFDRVTYTSGPVFCTLFSGTDEQAAQINALAKAAVNGVLRAQEGEWRAAVAGQYLWLVVDADAALFGKALAETVEDNCGHYEAAEGETSAQPAKEFADTRCRNAQAVYRGLQDRYVGGQRQVKVLGFGLWLTPQTAPRGRELPLAWAECSEGAAMSCRAVVETAADTVLNRESATADQCREAVRQCVVGSMVFGPRAQNKRALYAVRDRFLQARFRAPALLSEAIREWSVETLGQHLSFPPTREELGF